MPWRDLPEEFGPWSTAWDLFDKWNDDGTFDAVLARLRSSRIEAGNVDDQLWCIDGISVRAARCADGGAKKKIRKNRQITPWDELAGVFPAKSTRCATVIATSSTST